MLHEMDIKKKKIKLDIKYIYAEFILYKIDIENIYNS